MMNWVGFGLPEMIMWCALIIKSTWTQGFKCWMKVSLVDDDSRVVGPDHIFWVGMTSASPSGPKNHWVWLQTHQKITMYGVIKVNRPKNKFEFSCVVGWLAKVSEWDVSVLSGLSECGVSLLASYIHLCWMDICCESGLETTHTHSFNKRYHVFLKHTRRSFRGVLTYVCLMRSRIANRQSLPAQLKYISPGRYPKRSLESRIARRRPSRVTSGT